MIILIFNSFAAYSLFDNQNMYVDLPYKFHSVDYFNISGNLTVANNAYILGDLYYYDDIINLISNKTVIDTVNVNATDGAFSGELKANTINATNILMINYGTGIYSNYSTGANSQFAYVGTGSAGSALSVSNVNLFGVSLNGVQLGSSTGGFSCSNVNPKSCQIRVNNTAIMHFTNNSLVGIGTTSPAYTLDITTAGIMRSGTVITGTYYGNNLRASTNATGFAFYPNQGTATVLFMNMSTGNVGVGTSIPSTVLDIKYPSGVSSSVTGITIRTPSNYFNGITLINENTSQASAPSLTWTSNGTSLTIRKDQAGRILHFLNSSGLYSASVGTTGANSYFQFDGGNFGIGTQTPLSKLNVVGQAGDDTDLPFIDRYVGSNGAAVSAIILRKARGTLASPSFIWKDDGLGGFGARGYGNTSFSSGSRAYVYSYAGENWTDSSQGTYIAFGTTPLTSNTVAERMRIDNVGNVGIGTTTPAQLLTVKGTANITGRTYHETNSTYRSANGSSFNCGVSNIGVWSCS